MTEASTQGRLTVYERVEDLPPLWDVMAETGGMSFSRRFLHAVLQCAVDCARRFFVYQSPTGGAGIAVAQVLLKPCRHNPVTDVLLGRFSGRLAAGRNWLVPMLLLSTDAAGDVPIVTSAPAGHERSGVRCQMLSALGEHARREGWVLAVSGIPADDAELIAVLRRLGYLQTEGRPCAELYLRWNSWESYLKHARTHSKGASTVIRNEVNRARRDGVTFAEWDPLEIPESALHSLLDVHERRQNGRGFRFREGFLSALKQALGNGVRVLLAFRDGHVQGMTVLASDGRRGYVMCPGLIDKGARAGLAYFNLIFYQPILLAIELGLESLVYGSAVFPAKIRRGATVTATGLFIRPRHALSRAVLGGPIALHRRALQQKYAPILQASPFSSVK